MFNTAYLCQSSCSDMGMHPHAHRHSRKHTHILKHKHTHKAHVKGNENGKKPWRNKLLDIIGLYINYRLCVFFKDFARMAYVMMLSSFGTLSETSPINRVM